MWLLLRQIFLFEKLIWAYPTLVHKIENIQKLLQKYVGSAIAENSTRIPEVLFNIVSIITSFFYY